MGPLVELKNDLLKLKTSVDQFLDSSSSDSNSLRRYYYSKAELLLLELEDKYTEEELKENKDGTAQIVSDIVKLTARIPLRPIKRRRYLFDDACRFIFINSGLFFLGIFASLPLILVKFIESQILRRENFASVMIRKWFAWLMLTSAGVVTETIGLDQIVLSNSGIHHDNTQEPVSLLTFAHNSNFDGFIVSLTCPWNHYALAKKELFIIPFFSWLSFAIGGVPVDRQNRERAVAALSRSTRAAQTDTRVCLVIAPEGKRSTTGQLLSFKKGAFHMWEQLHSPVIPFISFGGYDLFPVGDWVNRSGRIIIQYLSIIQPSEATSRDHMMRLLRRRMLHAFMTTPTRAGDPLTWLEYLNTYIVGITVLSFNVISVRTCNAWVHRMYGYSSWMNFLLFWAICWVITIVMYIHQLYLVDLFEFKKK
jgi:1-acyl-sn-glycerol-3-phosphate acyltransferase